MFNQWYGIFYEQLLKMVPALQSHRDNVSADLCVHFVGGGMAGITAATSTYPLDLVRTRLAAQVRSIVYDFPFCVAFSPLAPALCIHICSSFDEYHGSIICA